MRIAIFTKKNPNGKLECKLGTLPDTSDFPVTVFLNTKGIDHIEVDDFSGHKNLAERSAAMHEAASIISNLATLTDNGDLGSTTTPSQFAKVIEDRHGRQVVKVGGKLITIGKIKEKGEKAEKQWHPIIGGKIFDHPELLVEAEIEKEASKKMQLRFITEAAEDKKLASSIAVWIGDGCKVSPIEVDMPKDFIDLHDFK